MRLDVLKLEGLKAKEVEPALNKMLHRKYEELILLKVLH